MNDDTQALSVDELVEYCRTQAGLLSGHVETMSVETNDLLDEIDEDIAEIQTHLEERANSTEGPTASPTTTGPNDPQHNFTELEELETELKEKCVLQTALGRAKRPEEVGKVAVFLASDLASYVTGESLVVNGGFISTNL